MPQKKILLSILIFLFIIPFFWIPYGTMDLGGDASRLYFYDSVSYLHNFSLFFIVPQGIGNVEPGFFSIPFLLLLTFFKAAIHSSYIVISLFNAFKLIIAFLSVYLIVREILANTKKISSVASYYASVSAGLMYLFMATMTDNWDKALLSHSQVFVNPFSFLLILKYFSTNNYKYLLIFLLFSFIFSHSFAYTSAPAFFAFFPMAIIFILLYALFILKRKIDIKWLLITFLFFIGLQAFHLIPQVLNVLDPGSYVNTRVFSKESIQNEGVRYFISILPVAKVSNYILLAFDRDRLIMFFVPLVIIIGIIFNKTNKKLLVLCASFYIVSLLLLSANVTDIWREVYKNLFYIPGFSMFRNFIGQWLFVYSFFYALLFGLSFYSLLVIIKGKARFVLVLVIVILTLVSGWKLISGASINRELLANSHVKVAINFSPDFLRSLEYVRSIPVSSKILTLPFTDSFYQVIPDVKYRGAYIGPSTVSYLGGKQDFSGYQVMQPFADIFLTLVKDKKYQEIKRLLGILNINYIYWNSDPFVLDKNNEPFLYGHVGSYLPQNQNAYNEFIQSIGGVEIYRSGYYRIYSLNGQDIYPHIYVPRLVIPHNNNDLQQLLNMFPEKRLVAYVDKSICRLAKLNCENINKEIAIEFKKINPTKYYLKVKKPESPFLLVLSDAFSPAWKIYPVGGKIKMDGTDFQFENIATTEYQQKRDVISTHTFETLFLKELPEQNHIKVNGYANAWILKNQGSDKEYHYILELSHQRVFYISFAISIVALFILLTWILLMYGRRKNIMGR